ncbi:MAG: carboxylesterase family protein [Planctomycetota bacterium]|jgi:predicted peptidase
MEHNVFKMKYAVLTLLFLLFIFAGGSRQSNMQTGSISPGSQVQLAFEEQVTTTLEIDYLLYLPKGYDDKDQKWPLMMFLHGAGERGSDINRVKKHGPPKLAEQGKDFPFIIVSPQCPKGQWWPKKTHVLLALLEDIIEKYNVDEDRVYLTGLSMGGYGTWEMACEHPHVFAAIVPVCGGGLPFLTKSLGDMPVWAFHGAKDKVVPLEKSQQMVDAIVKRGGNAKLTIYPEARHNSWTKTYENEQLYTWLLDQSRKK